MQENQRNDGTPAKRFREAVHGPIIRKLYATMPTADLAAKLGLTVKQIKNYVYRKNIGQWAKKDSSYLSRINSEKGKKGGRPRKYMK
jgi:uncharacterized protein YjcR